MNKENLSQQEQTSLEVIKRRIKEKTAALKESVDLLNTERNAEFKSSDLTIIKTINIDTTVSANPVDMVKLGSEMIFGFSVPKSASAPLTVEDVFSVYAINQDSDASLSESPLRNSVIYSDKFAEDVNKLFKFYNHAEFMQFIRKETRLYISFKVGERSNDLKVFAWDINKDGSLIYRSEYSGTSLFADVSELGFKWKELDRKAFVSGKYPLVNIKDTVYVSNTNGAIRIKNKSDTDSIDGSTLLKSDVADARQTLENGVFSYHQVGSLFLIKVQPYKEKAKYFIYDNITENAIEADGLSFAGVPLPEDNGILFSNGFYLKDGSYKVYDNVDKSAYHQKTLISPNGEDYLYVLYSALKNAYYLYQYNIVTKTVAAPMIANGYSLLDNGVLVISKKEAGKEASKIHALQVWSTTFYSDSFYNSLTKNQNETRVSKIGNTDLVKAIGDLNIIISFVSNKEISVPVYENVISMVDTATDKYHWFKEFSNLNFLQKLKEVKETALMVVQEFKKVEELRAFSAAKLAAAEKEMNELNNATYVKNDDLGHMMALIVKINGYMGELSSLKNERYIDQDKIKQLQDKANDRRSFVNNKIVDLLGQDKTYKDLEKSIEDTRKSIEKEHKYKDVKSINDNINVLTEQLSVINQEIGSLEFEDTTLLSNILEKVASIFAKLNQVKSVGKQKEKDLAFNEAKVEFASHSKLLEQSFKNSLNNAHNIESTDAEYANILSVLEGMEARFAEFDTQEFVDAIEKQRESIQTAFETHRQQLQSTLQKKVDNHAKAIDVSLKSISSKASKISDLKSLSSFFLTDGMVLRTRKLIKEIADLGDVSKSEDFATKLNNVETALIKKVRDDQDIFEDNGAVLKLGSHRFAVNKQAFEIVLVRKNDELFTHIQGTEFYRKVSTDSLQKELYTYWDYELISESKDLYRSEYLAYSILEDAKYGRNGLDEVLLKEIMDKGTRNSKAYSVLNLVQDYSGNLYKEGYIKGIHDEDAAKIMTAVYNEKQQVQEFNFLSKDRLAAYLMKTCNVDAKILKNISNGLGLLERVKSRTLLNKAIAELKDGLNTEQDFNTESLDYLVNHIARTGTTSVQVVEFYKKALEELSVFIEDMISRLGEKDHVHVSFDEKCALIDDLRSILESYCETDGVSVALVEETLIYILQKVVFEKVDERDVKYIINVKGLFGDHVKIKEGQLELTIEDFMLRNAHHRDVVMPIYEGVDKFKRQSLQEEKERISLSDFTAKPLSSFIKNKLISESYFPKIGANLAKQIGETGNKRKADTMGMLLLISPPGYGKTTLIEYIVNKLGMVFVKVNCPSIGHEVTSLDPEQAPNLTARKEIEKINLAFEMSSNVFLYLDDIQHTNSEFLQKFISFCDGTRTIDGVWEGQSKTYNLRNKRIAIAMAGNPYTESGEVFKIPDMLANRADTYNLGEILSDDREVFELSYIENAIVSNPITAPLANRSMNDIYRIIKMAEGIDVDSSEMEHQYSPTELAEMVKVIKMMKMIQKVVLKVNQQYIASASQNNEYRNEPPFKLQGSYRNMAKITERLVPVMDENEVKNLIMDHYQAESQTLTSSNEENLLKFKEITGTLSDADAKRWEDLKSLYKKGKKDGKDDALNKISDLLVDVLGKLPLLNE